MHEAIFLDISGLLYDILYYKSCCLYNFSGVVIGLIRKPGMFYIPFEFRMYFLCEISLLHHRIVRDFVKWLSDVIKVTKWTVGLVG